MIEDKRQLLEDLLAGWKHYVLDGYQKGHEAFPLAYVAATERLYQRAVHARLEGADPADLFREHLLPLFGIALAPRVMYGWTEQDVLNRWDELRSSEEVEDKEMPVADAIDIFEKALARNVIYERSDEALDEALNTYAIRKGLVKHDP